MRRINSQRHNVSDNSSGLGIGQLRPSNPARSIFWVRPRDRHFSLYPPDASALTGDRGGCPVREKRAFGLQTRPRRLKSLLDCSGGADWDNVASDGLGYVEQRYARQRVGMVADVPAICPLQDRNAGIVVDRDHANRHSG